MKTLTVSEFVSQVNDVLSMPGLYTVEGEVSDFKIKSGKWVLFDLKDENSVVHCFMTAWQLNTEIEDGMKVIAKGAATLKNWGQFSFNLKEIQPSGEGALKRAFDLMRKKLTEEGLFDLERKRNLPPFPQNIALITSRDAAAYSDFIKILQARQGGLNISFIHTQLQGKPAVNQIIGAIKTANTDIGDIDAIVLVRGGGSLEDLQSFNDERVVKAVASSRFPIIVGVGHERDFTLAELAADVRASTPSNAAEILVKSREQLTQQISNLQERLKTVVYDRLEEQKNTIKQVVFIFKNEVRAIKQRLTQLERILKTLSPHQILKRGYSITRTADGKVLKQATEAKTDTEIVTQLNKGKINSKVIKTYD